jgi:hypothetical protein
MGSLNADRGEYVNPQIISLPPADDVAELFLLLPSWQVSALEAEAHAHGLTTAALLRRLIEEHFGRPQRLGEGNARKWA